jgi:hypothetical protein
VTGVNATVLRRGNIRINGQRFPIAAVTATNDLIGLRDDAKYLRWTESTWQDLAPRRQLRRWLAEGVPALLARAAEQLREQGTLPYSELAPYLETVERTDPDRITVPSLPSLAAWALSRSADSGAIVSICGECGLPWISRRTVDYCYRPAPAKTITCAQLHAHARFAKQRTDWNREYRRIYARKLRGTVSNTDWRAWLTAIKPLRDAHLAVESYTFDAWKQDHALGLDAHIARFKQMLEPEWGEQETQRQLDELLAVADREAERQAVHAACVAAILKRLQQPAPVDADAPEDEATTTT